ncbi:MAG: right-handed parallel beta-helix repeat-containing protein, partial [Candidatus Hodarchaeales archaeon]
MLRRRNNLPIIGLFLTLLGLYLSSKSSLVQISLSNSVFSVHKSTSQSYLEHAPINITNDNELAVIANSGTGTIVNPFLITGWNITNARTYGLFVIGTTKHFRIADCWIGNSTLNGIVVTKVTTGTATITDNICTNNGEAGILVDLSVSIVVTNNICNYNGYSGIIGWSSNSSVVTNNICSNNGKAGIEVWYSASSTIKNNICNWNNQSGSSGVAGIEIYLSDFSTIIKNTCDNNFASGISMTYAKSSMVSQNGCNNNSRNGITLAYDSNDNILMWNEFSGNGNYGVHIHRSGSENNSIHHNTFIENRQITSQPNDTIQAYDAGTNNHWYDETGLEGNYWSDYKGTGNYSIAGFAGASDPYPALSPFIYPNYPALSLDFL